MTAKSPLSNLPGWARAEQMNPAEFDALLRAAFDLQPKYTLPRDHHAEQLALKVGELAGELERGVG